MSGYEVYKTYLALKTHFNNDTYDFHKNNGQVSVKPDTFYLRKDRWTFEKVYVKHPKDYFEFLLSNFVDTSSFYIKSFNTEHCKNVYADWKRRKESRLYLLEQCFSTFEELCKEKNITIKNIFKPQSNSHPILLQLYMSDKIDIECFIIFYRLFKLSHLWNQYENDVVYKNIINKVKKYKLFVTILPKYRECIDNEFNRLQNSNIH